MRSETFLIRRPAGHRVQQNHHYNNIDGQTVLTGSFNFTKQAEENNAENLLVIDDPALTHSLPNAPGIGKLTLRTANLTGATKRLDTGGERARAWFAH